VALSDFVSAPSPLDQASVVDPVLSAIPDKALAKNGYGRCSVDVTPY
jgi:hypothetical protein